MSQTSPVSELGDVDNARKVYAATRDVWIGGGNWHDARLRIGGFAQVAGRRFDERSDAERDLRSSGRSADEWLHRARPGLLSAGRRGRNSMTAEEREKVFP